MPYADPAARREWYRRKYAKDPAFWKRERERVDAYFKTEEGAEKNRRSSIEATEKRNPHKVYKRFNLDLPSGVRKHREYIGQLESDGVPFRENLRGTLMTVSALKRDLARMRQKAA